MKLDSPLFTELTTSEEETLAGGTYALQYDPKQKKFVIIIIKKDDDDDDDDD